jgi:hypothetical protein
MEAEPNISVLLATAAENWVWLMAAFVIGFIVGWMTYPARSRRGAARR